MTHPASQIRNQTLKPGLELGFGVLSFGGISACLICLFPPEKEIFSNRESSAFPSVLFQFQLVLAQCLFMLSKASPAIQRTEKEKSIQFKNYIK